MVNIFSRIRYNRLLVEPSRPLRLGLLVGQLVCASLAVGAAGTTVIQLKPSAAPPLRIDFNYSFTNALSAFEKEPPFPGKEIVRGQIPTFPLTPFLRNITDNELLLNVDHSYDFVTGKIARFRSTYDGHVLFKNLTASSLRDGVEIPYALSLVTYERFCSGWLNVLSGWAGDFQAGTNAWRLTVVDNLDARIGPGDTLHLQPLRDGGKGRIIPITPVPEMLFLDGQAFSLDFKFMTGETGAVLQAVLTATNLPLGQLTVATRGVAFLVLSNGPLAAVIDAKVPTGPIPAGTYKLADSILDQIPGVFRQPQFIRADRVVDIAAGQAGSMQIGSPLRNTVQVSRERNVLRLTYQLLGQGGEQYEYYNWKERPQFAVYQGPVKIGGGSLPFG